MNTLLRQGDMELFLVLDTAEAQKVREMNAVKRDNIVVGLGEHSGHQHVIRNMSTNGTELLEYVADEKAQDSATRNEVYFEVKGGSVVITHNHEASKNMCAEHKPLLLKPGLYKRVNQREYEPFTGMIRAVRD